MTTNTERIQVIKDNLQLAEDALDKVYSTDLPTGLFNVQIALTALRAANSTCQVLERSLAGVPEPRIGA